MSKQIKGINKLINNIKKFGKEAEKDIDLTIQSVSTEIQANAKINAPINNGDLKQSILKEKTKDKDLSYSIYVGGVAKSYGVYVEFGTGKQVSVPAELSELASELRKKDNKGSFDKGLQSIRDWCKNKKIDEKLAYPIFMAILKKGLRPRPYLYPAFVKGKKTLKRDLKDLLKHLTKKYNG